jgi:hypothetical protein
MNPHLKQLQRAYDRTNIIEGPNTSHRLAAESVLSQERLDRWFTRLLVAVVLSITVAWVYFLLMVLKFIFFSGYFA